MINNFYVIIIHFIYFYEQFTVPKKAFFILWFHFFALDLMQTGLNTAEKSAPLCMSKCT